MKTKYFYTKNRFRKLRLDLKRDYTPQLQRLKNAKFVSKESNSKCLDLILDGIEVEIYQDLIGYLGGR